MYVLKTERVRYVTQVEKTFWYERLRQERIRRNWRQREVADKLDTTVVTVTRWEKGSHLPSTYFRVKLCVLYEKSPEELGFVENSTSAPSVEKSAVEASDETMKITQEQSVSVDNHNENTITPNETVSILQASLSTTPLEEKKLPSRPLTAPLTTITRLPLQRRKFLLLAAIGLGAAIATSSLYWLGSRNSTIQQPSP